MIKNRHDRNIQNGFTLVELLIVIVVIGILAAIALVSYSGVQASAGIATLKSDLKQAQTVLEVAKVEAGNYPASEDLLPISEDTQYEYNSDGSTYCITASSERAKTSFYLNSVSGVIQEGVCGDDMPIEDIVYSVGDTGPAEGVIFYDKGSISDGWRYLEAAPNDLPGKYEWGCYGITVGGADGSTIGSGVQNTADIVTQGCSSRNGNALVAAISANSYSVNGLDDWFLPSREELNALYLQKAKLGVVDSFYYWSSSENANNMYALAKRFDTGTWLGTTKSNLFSVRAIRAF